MDGLLNAANERQFDASHRDLLVKTIRQQAKQSNYADEVAMAQLERLGQDGVYTVTTGHQLCLYGGPMFFLYKMLSVVRLCEQLKQQNVDCVPIYWMASEDHDFEEVNHIFLGDQKFSWDVEAQGAVGEMTIQGLQGFKDAVGAILKDDHRYEDALVVLDEIFTEGKTLSLCIQDFVYWATSGLGILVLDANNSEMKTVFRSIMERELLEGIGSKALAESDSLITELGYETQVNHREINLFYLIQGYRERLVRLGEGFGTADGQHRWSKEEVLELLAVHPERFSPNVVLRPVYQECVLPNIAYVGGPGETAYWLQLKPLFDALGVSMPVVLLRDMFVLVEPLVEKKRAQLGLKYDQLSSGTAAHVDALLTKLVKQEGTHEYLVGDPSNNIESEFKQIIASLSDFDPTLAESARAEQTKAMKRLQALQKKVLRADKRRSEVIKTRLDVVINALHPGGHPQERHNNWLHHFIEPKLVQEMLSSCDPLSIEVKVLLLNGG